MSTKWGSRLLRGNFFYIGSPVSIKFIDVLDTIFPIVLIFTLNDFYLYTLHTHTKLFSSICQRYHTVKLTISDH